MTIERILLFSVLIIFLSIAIFLMISIIKMARELNEHEKKHHAEMNKAIKETLEYMNDITKRYIK